MASTYSVTGTDTRIDKTIISCALLQAAGQSGLQTVGYKLVMSDSEMAAEGLRNSGALILWCSSIAAVDYAAINPYTSAKPASPYIISANEGCPIQASMMSAGLHLLEEQANWVLMGGADGWFTPLSPALSFSNWVKVEQLPVILVVDAKLGCINHAISTTQAVQQAELTLAGWVANDVQPPGRRHAGYMMTLKRALVAPLLEEIP